MKLNKKPSKIRKISNRNFSDEYFYVGAYDIPTEIRVTYYNEKEFETKTVDNETSSFKRLLRPNSINWVEFNGLTDSSAITRFVKEFGLGSLDLKDILTPGHIVKVDTSGDRIVLILTSCYFNGEEGAIRTEHISIFAQKDVVVTFTESDREHSVFRDALVALSKNTMNVRNEGSGLLLAFLINTFLAVQVETATYVETMLEDIEQKLLTDDREYRQIGVQIQKCRHAQSIIRKNMIPLMRLFPKLQVLKKGVIDEGMMPVYEDLSDQLGYVVQTVDNSKEILSSLVDLYVSQSDMRTNVIMKRLTVVSTFFIPITFLAGVWGMNFELMPEIGWQHGYLFAWGTMIIVVMITWMMMKKNKWF